MLPQNMVGFETDALDINITHYIPGVLINIAAEYKLFLLFTYEPSFVITIATNTSYLIRKLQSKQYHDLPYAPHP
jgi:hypothetical protein